MSDRRSKSESESESEGESESESESKSKGTSAGAADEEETLDDSGTGTPNPDEPDPDEPDLGERATRSTGWAMLGYGGGQVLRFIGNLILTRLLFEEAFGMMALVNVLLQGLELFSDIGTGPSIVQNKRGDDPLFLNTAWTLQVGRGFVLWAFACAITVPASQFYGEPMLLWLIPVSGLAAILQGFYSTKYFTVSRHLNLKRLTLVNIGSQALALVVMVSWALISPTLWALVAGGLVAPALRMVLTHAVLPGPQNRIAWDPAAARALFSFGRWIFLSTILTFATTHADRLVFGKMIPLDLLGVYSIGMMLATMPAWGLGHLASSVTFPLYARVRDAGLDLTPIVRQVRWPFLILGGWSLSGMVGGGQVAVDLLYDERYHEAGWIVQLLSIMSWLTIMEGTNGSALLAKGKASWLAAGGMAKLIGMLIFIPIGYQALGFKGAVAGFVLGEALKFAVSALATQVEGIGGRPAELGLTILATVSSLVGYVCANAITDAGLHVVIAAAGVFLSVSACWCVVGVPFLLRVRREGNPLRVGI